MVELTETLRFRLHIERGKREHLGQARFDAQAIANHALAMRKLGYSKTEICDQLTLQTLDYVKNNAQAVARKACDAYKSYQCALEQWKTSDDNAELPKPHPPSTTRKGAFPLVMAYTEGYTLSLRDDARVGFRISPQPSTPVEGFLRGRKRDIERVTRVLHGESEWSVGRAEVVYRDGVYYLHVTVSRDQPLTDPETAQTIISVDVNERNIAITALARDSRRVVANLVVDYGHVKHERQRCYDIRRRCHAQDKPSAVARMGNYLENYTAWTIHRVSKIVEYYVEWFADPVVVFETLEGIREDIEYGSYMNRRLHKLPFYEVERQVTYKVQRHGTPVMHVGSRYNSQRCACCGSMGSRQGCRFECDATECELVQDHADRNATVNTAVKGIAKVETGEDSHAVADTYRPRKTPPQVRVRRVGSGRDVSRPTPSLALAEQGVLA